MTRTPVYLVACAKTKASSPAKAKDLYRSAWFRKARRYVEGAGAQWFILSAAHGLTDPDAMVAPYDKTLTTMSAQERLAWAEGVYKQLLARCLLPGFNRKIIFLAGKAYREHLCNWLTLDGRQPDVVDAPMQGLGLGQQLAWLTARAQAGDQDAGPPVPEQMPAIDWDAVPDERPPVNDNNEAYIAHLRAQLPLRVRRRWGRDAGSDPALAGLDTPLFRSLIAGT